MKLSVLLPTHRHDLLACSRIMQACSWASADVEVIVRDNSGNAQKRDMLANIQRDNCNIIIADECDALKNYSEILRVAKGEFVFCVADDDYCPDRSIEAISATIKRLGSDASVAGVTGHYGVETSQVSGILHYQGLDSGDAIERVKGYLKFSGPNVLNYSAQRRDMTRRVFAFLSAMPAVFSFHDQILCLLYLLNGKFVSIPRLMYLYDLGLWEDPESGQRRDLDFYTAAGLDPAINKLHWYLCCFEGAVLARNSDLFPDLAIERRQVIADLWSALMYARFTQQLRLTFGSPFTDEAEKICAKLRAITTAQTFDDMLADICSVIALFSKEKAQAYFEFWDAVVNRRNSAPGHAEYLAETRVA
jgi:hypothetical protein